MKKLFLAFAIAGLALSANAQKGKKATANNSTVQLTSANTTVKWEGKAATHGHDGTVAVESGTVALTNGVPTSAHIVMNMDGIKCTDIADADKNAGLLKHLKGEDFFDVAKYPTAMLDATAFKAEKGGTYLVSASLTIKDKTLPITFRATISAKDKTFKATSAFTFDRTKFGVQYASGIVGAAKDKMIYDEVKLNISINATY